MEYIILQYVLVVLLVVGVGYLLYLLKDREVTFNEDYFGITYNILSSLRKGERTTENVKKIIRLISEAVFYVEKEYKYEYNEIKERRALKLVKKSLKELNLRKNIDEYSIIYIIRILAAALPPTNNTHMDNIKDKLV